jgi:hypothetical protein
MKSRVLESLAGTTTAKWMACSSTMAVWTNSCTLDDGKEVGKRMEVDG